MNGALLLALAAIVLCLAVVFIVSVRAGKAQGERRSDGTGSDGGSSSDAGPDCAPGDTGGCDSGGGSD